MRCLIRLLCILSLSVSVSVLYARDIRKHDVNEYVIIAGKTLIGDVAWEKVVGVLAAKHQAAVFYYGRSPREALDSLRKWNPRYVAIVEKPENIGRDYVIGLHQMSREVDQDIYADYLWGIITGYDAAAALKMVENGTEPMVIKSAVATLAELSSAKWFDRFAWIDDHQDGLCGEKTGIGTAVKTYKIAPETNLRKFFDFYKEYEPDLVVTSGHATERNLETPFSHGNLKSKNGVLYAAFPEGKENLVESGKRKVFFGVGNCLIGNVDHSPMTMAVAWMNSGNATAMTGYVVTTWYGRSGWGGFKYWMSTPGRYTLAEAIYLNEQDMLYQLNAWDPALLKVNYPFTNSEGLLEQELNKAVRVIASETKILSPDKDQIGFLHDRDVLAYYGDPKWNVRLQEVPAEKDYDVSCVVSKGKCVVKVKTFKNFSPERMAGDKFKQEHVKDLPFSYFFPSRLQNPRPAEGCRWKMAVDENFLLVYQPDFQPGRTYKIVLDINE